MSHRTEISQRYRGASQVGAGAVRLVADLERAPVRVDGRIREPLLVREALSALHAIVRSDMRYKPKDRAAYVAFQRMRKRSAELAGLRAQREYFDWLARNDPLAWFVLDPVVTVHPDGISFEVFSKDEGTYARLFVARDALETDGDWVCGTTNVDFSDALYDGVQRLRSTGGARLSIAPDAVELAADDDSVVEKRVAVPDSWLRGFLQVQSAATLARASVHLTPMELYNTLRHLRMNADRKRQGRALRVELVPGETPRVVLEPWSWLLETSSGPYTGPRPEVVRIWGRRRWMLLRRLLPFARGADLHVLGSGLPSFLVLDAGAVQLTLGLTGFTAANWSRALQLDTLLPRSGGGDDLQQAILTHLRDAGAADRAQLAEATAAAPEDVLAALQALGQAGHLLFELSGRVRLRQLTAAPLQAEALRYRSDAERVAHDLLAAKAIKLTREEVVHGSGTALAAKVTVAADKRTYQVSFTLDDEGRVGKASCTCTAFRSHGLKEGPCPHLIATRLRIEELRIARAKRRGAALLTETRTYARRTEEGEAVTQLSLDKRRLKVRWGLRKSPRLRMQNLVFDTVEDARAAYLGRLERLETAGWLDASAS